MGQPKQQKMKTSSEARSTSHFRILNAVKRTAQQSQFLSSGGNDVFVIQPEAMELSTISEMQPTFICLVTSPFIYFISDSMLNTSAI